MNLPDHTEVRKAKVQARRLMIASLYLSGQYTLAAIVEKLNEEGIPCDLDRVNQDIKVLTKHWRDQSAQAVDVWIKRESAKLDMAEAAIATKVISDPFDYVFHLLRIQDRRAKLLGLDQPVKVAVERTTTNLSQLSDAELENIIQRRRLYEAQQRQLVEGASPSTIEGNLTQPITTDEGDHTNKEGPE